MTTLIDTDALIAIVIENDALHPQTVALHQRLANEGAKVLLLSSALAEFVSMCTNKIGVARTQQAVQTFIRTYSLCHVDDNIMEEALPLYYKQTSKENSLFDCYIMIASKKFTVDFIFSFDGGYKQNGFQRIAEFLNVPPVNP
jgi:predicted nucleic acid-binding protein